MSDRWHYRVQGRDLGPVDFGTLQLMAAEERLFGDDEIRLEESEAWVAAETVPGLFPEAADEDDLSSMLGDADTDSIPEDRQNGDESCYCRTRTEELGPMSQEQLMRLARQGRLAPRDQVRLGHQATWVEARSVPGLFSDPNQATTDATAMMAGFEIVADPTPRKPKTPRPELEPVLQMEEDAGPAGDDVIPISGPARPLADVEAKWNCRVLGQEIGPIGWNDLRELVETRQLGPNDRVRKENSVAWVPAGTIDNLFQKRKPKAAKGKKKKKLSEEEAFDFLQPEPEPEPETTSHLAPQRSFAPVSRKSSPDVAAKGGPDGGFSRPAATDAPRSETKAAPAPSAETPAAAAPRPSPPPAPPMSPPARPVPPRPAPRERRKMGNPFSGVGGKIGGMFGSMGGSMGGLANQWKPIVAILVLVAIAGVLTMGGLPSFGDPGKVYYDETKVMWTEAERIKSSGSADEWTKFCAATLPRVKELAAELDPIATADKRLTQLMLFCHRDCLPLLLSGPKDGNPLVWKEMTGYMKEADQIASQL